MSAKLCIRTEEAAEGICTYRYEYKGRGFQMKKHVIAAVKREMGSGMRAFLVVVLQCAVAWLMAFAVYQIGGIFF